MLPSPAVQSFIPQSIKPKAWYLDVASPTWEDMRTLGKILHLHPLTLEDILQRDPREKLELFPKLGYYFISFRAIDSASRNRTEDRMEVLDGSAPDAGIIGEANVYLIVFKEGICSFHFTDISEHTDRVINRIALLQGVINMSSDWIAHGILDSIVDSFFPLLEEIEQEVAAIEDLVLTAGGGGAPVSPRQYDVPLMRTSRKLDEKQLWANVPSHLSPTQMTLRRMARTRRLITSLTRLLATKSEVVAQIRKRLLTVNGTRRDDNLDVAIYMGDVQDHILTLQHSLVDYERILSQSHPTYLSQLRTGVALTKRSTDKSILYLTVVNLAVPCVQPLIGLMSTNIHIPTNLPIPKNPDTPTGSFHVFGIVISLAIGILCVYISVVRWWWRQAKTKIRQHKIL
ncbi:Putative metal ion transporter C17A12.14 [Termitomyces sp. J132]|nr:Putative metal ion transporter C17A12.14 [Termitomyces sp. J132]